MFMPGFDPAAQFSSLLPQQLGDTQLVCLPKLSGNLQFRPRPKHFWLPLIHCSRASAEHSQEGAMSQQLQEVEILL